MAKKKGDSHHAHPVRQNEETGIRTLANGSQSVNVIYANNFLRAIERYAQPILDELDEFVFQLYNSNQEYEEELLRWLKKYNLDTPWFKETVLETMIAWKQGEYRTIGIDRHNTGDYEKVSMLRLKLPEKYQQPRSKTFTYIPTKETYSGAKKRISQEMKEWLESIDPFFAEVEGKRIRLPNKHQKHFEWVVYYHIYGYNQQQVANRFKVGDDDEMLKQICRIQKVLHIHS